MRFELGTEYKNGQNRDGKLACKESPQISLHPENGYGKEYPCDTDKKTGCVDEKSGRRSAKPVDRAQHGRVRVEKRADPCEGHDKASGCLAVEQESADK